VIIIDFGKTEGKEESSTFEESSSLDDVEEDKVNEGTIPPVSKHKIKILLNILNKESIEVNIEAGSIADIINEIKKFEIIDGSLIAIKDTNEKLVMLSKETFVPEDKSIYIYPPQLEYQFIYSNVFGDISGTKIQFSSHSTVKQVYEKLHNIIDINNIPITINFLKGNILQSDLFISVFKNPSEIINLGVVYDTNNHYIIKCINRDINSIVRKEYIKDLGGLRIKIAETCKLNVKQIQLVRMPREKKRKSIRYN